MCIFYHVSNLDLEEGRIFTINDFEGDCTYDHLNRPEAQQSINIQMDECRPNSVLSRMKCIYVFDNLAHSKVYARSIHQERIYEVRCNGTVCGPYPMTLVNTALRCGNDRLPEVLREYWNSTQNWKVHEYLADSITIIRSIPLANGGNIIDDFIDDRQLSRRIFNV